MRNEDAILETELYIDGERRRAGNGRTYDLFNPARPDELVGKAAKANIEDVNAAVKSAHTAFPAWSQLSYGERADYLNKVADYLVADQDDVEYRSILFTREHGKIRKETLLEMTRLGDRFRLSASYADRLATDEKISGPPLDTIITRQPRGVAALIVPWNWPLSILGAKLPQALMSGNTIVVKPAENSAMAPALTIQKIAEILPRGVVNLITGSSSEIGDPLTTHPLVRYVNFTGSVDVGKHVMRMAADNLTPITLELGGNDAALILEDAELSPEAFTKMYLGAFMSSGQICMAIKRMYVHRSVYDDVVDGFTAICQQQVIGDGLLPETTMGPVNNAKQLKVVTDIIDQARAAGSDIKECGQVPDEDLYAKGYFQRPALIYNPDQSLDIVQKEQFGPALPIMPFDTEDEAIALANDSNFGLCSSIWTQDPDRAVRLARRIEAGCTFLNNHGPASQDARAPFGGFKDSGISRNLGYEGIIQFQEYQSISSPPGYLF